MEDEDEPNWEEVEVEDLEVEDFEDFETEIEPDDEEEDMPNVTWWHSLSDEEKEDEIVEMILSGDWIGDGGKVECKLISTHINDAMDDHEEKINGRWVASMNMKYRKVISERRIPPPPTSARTPATPQTPPQHVEVLPPRPAPVMADGLIDGIPAGVWYQNEKEQREFDRWKEEQTNQRKASEDQMGRWIEMQTSLQESRDKLYGDMMTFMNENRPDPGANPFGGGPIGEALMQRFTDDIVNPQQTEPEESWIKGMRLAKELDLKGEIVSLIREIKGPGQDDPSYNPYAGEKKQLPAPQQQQQPEQQKPKDLVEELKANLFGTFAKSMGYKKYEDIPQKTGFTLQQQVEITADVVHKEHGDQTPEKQFEIMRERLKFVRSVRAIGVQAIKPIVEGTSDADTIAKMVWEKAPREAVQFSQVTYENMMHVLEPYNTIKQMSYDFKYFLEDNVATVCKALLDAIRMNEPGNGAAEVPTVSPDEGEDLKLGPHTDITD